MPLLHSVSRRQRLLRGRVLLVGVAVAVSGCASTSEPSLKQEETRAEDTKGSVGEVVGGIGGAAVGGVGGAAAGAVYGLRCGIAFFVCSPVGAVIGGGIGLVKGAEVGGDLGRSLAESTRTDRAPAPVKDEGPQYVGELPDSDFSRPGSLFVERHSYQMNDMRRTATLHVNLERRTEDSTKSIEADVDVDCATGSVNFVMRRTYDSSDASGQALTSGPSTKGMAPGPQLDAVKRIICGHEWNSPMLGNPF